MLDKRQPIRGEIVQPEEDDYLNEYEEYTLENRSSGPIHPLPGFNRFQPPGQQFIELGVAVEPIGQGIEASGQ